MNYRNSKVELLKGDCLELMEKLIKEGVKVDLTVTSPPYDNLRRYEGSLQWNEEIWKGVIKRLYDITANGGVVVWVVGDATLKGSETGTSFKQALFAIECGFRLHDTMIYRAEKPPLTHRRYEQKFEYMFIFTKGKIKTFNPILEQTKYSGKNRKGGTLRQDSDNLSSRCGKGIVKDFKIKGNIWEFAIGGSKSTKDKIAFKHPAIFPEQLANDHIISWSNEGDLVFDPFMGSGTTGKMAIKNNRNFIGIEKVDKYFEIAKERIEDADQVLPL
jgi:site-specific DNA-methyltransferase (adenine-specific)